MTVPPPTADAFALPPAASEATKPRAKRTLQPQRADAAPATGADARARLLRLVPHADALAALDATQDQYEASVADGRGWPIYATPGGVVVADAAEVLSVLTAIGGPA